jgi:hypothetical protein
LLVEESHLLLVPVCVRAGFLQLAAQPLQLARRALPVQAFPSSIS